MPRIFSRKIELIGISLDKFLSKLSYDFVYTPADFDPNNYPEIRDINDLPILVSALVGGVDLIITGDKDFFDIKVTSDEFPIIMTPKEFIDKFG